MCVLRSLFAMVIALGLPPALIAQAGPAGAVTIGHRDSILSPTLREWRRYQVYVPPGYASSEFLPRAYPVLYLLDGSTHFHSLTGLIQFFGDNFVVPEMIVVAIANTDRTRDLTPTHSTKGTDGKPEPARATSGGGDNFLKFVRSELIPHIDSTFRTEPFRVLVGHSFGGLTAINALYTMPEVFNAYVAIDPSMWWDARILIGRADSYLTRGRLASRTLFLAQANTVDQDARDSAGPCGAPSRSVQCADTGLTSHFRSIGDFDKVLQVDRASGLRYAFRYYPYEDHNSVPLIAEYDALRFIFDGFMVDFDKKPAPVAVAARFAALSNRLGFAVLPSEKLLSEIGGSAAQIDSAWALSFARYNTQLYPRSPRAFDVLGGAFLATGDTTAARGAYEQAIVLDPQNQRIKDLLVKLRR